MNILIWSFWTSDLYLNWKIINTREENFLEKTKEILDNYKKYENSISFPMFKQFDEQFLNWNYEEIIVKWIFTDQNYKTDTIYIKDIFYRWLKKYENSKRLKYARNHIILADANKFGNVSDNINLQLKEQIQINIKNVLVNITWWTKWIVAWLILSTLSYFDLEKLSFFYGERLNSNSSETIFTKQAKCENYSVELWLLTPNQAQIILEDNYQ